MPTETSVPIPQPKTYGPLGNLPLLDLEAPTQSLVKLAYEYGPIFQMRYGGGRKELYISGHKLVADACDESKFDKKVWAPLERVRAFAGDGLFTSWTSEPNWQKAHNILLPSFSQRAMQGYHNMMVDIAVQLVQKWSRLNPDEVIDVAEDMTRLTLDTIGLCGFNYRFNSFYREQPHPFIVSMVRALDEAMNQLLRLNIQDKLMIRTKRRFQQDISTMFSLVDKIIAERKAGGDQDAEDLLARMLNSKDPETGEGLDDENIRYQIITFLIAGHETTSGLLSFAVYYLLKHPDKLQKAQEEADRVLTDPVPTYRQVLDLKYVRMVLNESLRLWPTAPAFSLYAKEDTMLGGQYPLKKNDSVSVLIPKLHRDPDAWGDNAEEFIPERFADQKKVPQHAYKPFGNGQRACIGQQFALHEATLVLGMVLKHFDFIDYSNYELKVKETLTLKPDGFTIKVKERKPIAFAAGSPAAEIAATAVREEEREKSRALEGAEDFPLLILYGSNLGTAEGIARELADSARQYGMKCRTAPLNDWAGKLPQEGAVLIIAASYNGKPSTNARGFVEWLEHIKPKELQGVQYAVFGCGDRNWSSTYQDVPRFIDEQMHKAGAVRITQRGEGDASADFEQDLDSWRAGLWSGMADRFGFERYEGRAEDAAGGILSIKPVQQDFASPPIAAAYQAVPAAVLTNRELQSPASGRSTRHIVIALPEGQSYQEGDHLGILPCNRSELVDIVLRRFGMDPDSYIKLEADGERLSHLPLGIPVRTGDLLETCVELQEPATRSQLKALAAFTVCPPHKRELEALLSEELYRSEVLGKRISMLDLLLKYEACEMPFERFLELLPPLKPRYYSISSSPREIADQASITVGVVKGEAWSGRGEYRGVASSYLAEREAGQTVMMFIRTPDSGFRLPEDPATPVIMVGPGTGVAPFRGFLQARSFLKSEGHPLGPAYLFYGCRNDDDYLYREELERYHADGIVKLHAACSRKQGTPKTYVQHLIREKLPELIGLLESGGKLYVCGDGSRMAPEVEAEFTRGYQEMKGVNEQAAADWLSRLQLEGRYAKDVWAGM
ncbi:bifunctional cytochrome P450/NADPH--P450 reductase [Paenibacillus tarimensis]|uniref:bifunctional cytochrome P450/NADPH--P450 reductase n=1 Tax=Paenibacillus tarimensis TaxID=416012 RepID=UPI001F18A9C6|nr:cytochrome P450 [Paenibacillus tarimensis]MCF2945574.1 cytochrome P450 [Paenibacillus tarimensis]